MEKLFTQKIDITPAELLVTVISAFSAGAHHARENPNETLERIDEIDPTVVVLKGELARRRLQATELTKLRAMVANASPEELTLLRRSGLPVDEILGDDAPKKTDENLH